MQRFVSFVTRFKNYITFVALIIISLSLISMGSVSKIGGFRTVVIGSIGWLQEAFAWIPNPGALKSENRAVRDLNLRQSAELMKTRKSKIENEKLRNLLEYKEQVEYPIIAAEIVGRNTVELRNYFTINKGVEDNLKRGMTARTDAGVVGRVIGSSVNYSIIESIMNRNVRIAAKIQRTSFNGVIVWEGDEYLYLKHVPTSFDVQIGDVVLTSNYSNKYPMDIPIGQVVNIENEPGSLFFKITVEPYVNFSTIQQVFIITHVPDEERLKLIEDIEQRLLLRKKKK